VILVFVTRNGLQSLLRSKVTIGADVSAAAGPVGREAAVATDGRLRAEIYSYSRSRGLFAGPRWMARCSAWTRGNGRLLPLGHARPGRAAPAGGARLLAQLAQYTRRQCPAGAVMPGPEPTPVDNAEALRRELADSAGRLALILDEVGNSTWPCRPRSTRTAADRPRMACARRWRGSTRWPARQLTKRSPGVRSSKPRVSCFGVTRGAIGGQPGPLCCRHRRADHFGVRRTVESA